ncbi:MAG: SUMF1/EgtB/PvdO family nonheme iron enzyme [Phycisphaeraceae bacterium]|nr:SUMF1/EgtB/PvdO family nonheme iron enzyme [Phycisphaeraceae bacterium]
MAHGRSRPPLNRLAAGPTLLIWLLMGCMPLSASAEQTSAPEPPEGMALIPGGAFRPGLSTEMEKKLEAHWASERAQLRLWLKRHPRLAHLAEDADDTEEPLDRLIERSRRELNGRRGGFERDLNTARGLLAEHPDDPYLRSRVATLSAALVDLDLQEALLKQVESRLAFIESQRTWLDVERNTGEEPVEIRIAPFYMDRTPVTVAQYRRFAEATGRSMPWPYQASSTGEANMRGHPRSLFPEQTHPSFSDDRSPITGVSHPDAVAYAQWAGKRLPTELEWEWAARGGANDPLFPWGDEPYNGQQANLGGERLATLSPANPNHVRIDGRPDLNDFPVLAPVGSFPPNGYGLYDMAGNVMQWCIADPAYDPNLYTVLGGRAQPVNPQTPRRWGIPAGNFQPLRGSGYTDMPFEARTTRRYGAPANHIHAERGFRCVKDIGDD